MQDTKTRQFLWYGQLMRIEERIIYEWIPIGRWKGEWPQIRWRKGIQEVMKERQLGIDRGEQFKAVRGIQG